MKRIIMFVLALALITFTFASCGNENWGIGSYTFTHVHIGDGDTGHCATIESWHDNELGVELHTVEFGNIYCSEGTYVLFGDGSNCPYCEEE